MARDDVWTEKQITIVLYEYCRRPFGQFSGTKPFLKELGELINRTPGAIVRKVGNLASFDHQMKARGVGGLAHTSKLDKEVWESTMAIGTNWHMMQNRCLLNSRIKNSKSL